MIIKLLEGVLIFKNNRDGLSFYYARRRHICYNQRYIFKIPGHSSEYYRMIERFRGINQNTI